jgi:HEPN domain-containing protein
MVLGPSAELSPRGSDHSLNSRNAARNLLSQARRRLETAKRENKRGGSKAYAVRSAQECAELSLKATLRFVGVDYPKRHDVSRVLLEMKERLPSWFDAETIAGENTWLAERRERAMYGLEESDVGPDSLFSGEDARAAISYSKHIFEECERLISGRERRRSTGKKRKTSGR